MGDYINTLDSSYPDGTVHEIFRLDDDAKDTKKKIKTTFPNITGEVTANNDELNAVDGVTSNVQSQINSLNDRYNTLASHGHVYRGKISAAGAGLSLPAGWSSSLSAGVYTVTHNLNDSNSVPALTIDSTSASNYWILNAIVQTPGNNSFSAKIYDVKTGTADSAGFYFVLHSTS